MIIEEQYIVMKKALEFLSKDLSVSHSCYEFADTLSGDRQKAVSILLQLYEIGVEKLMAIGDIAEDLGWTERSVKDFTGIAQNIVDGVQYRLESPWTVGIKTLLRLKNNGD